MPRKAFDTLSEPMFYVLMALRCRSLCGAEIVEWIQKKTDGHIVLVPARCTPSSPSWQTKALSGKSAPRDAAAATN